MKTLLVYLVFILSISLLNGCSDSNQKKDALSQEEAILNELSTLRKDVNELQKTVADLKLGRRNPRSLKQAVQFEVSNSQLGSETAQIAIIEFSDYQCPYCVRYHREAFAQIKQKYIDTGKVRYIIRDFPLPFHSQAKKAAVAANCAGKQNAYWAAHKVLLENYKQFNETFFLNLSNQIEIDSQKYRDCFNDPKELEKVDNDIVYAKTLGVKGTPKFFIGQIKNNQIVNAIPVSGAKNFSSFERIIDKILR